MLFVCFYEMAPGALARIAEVFPAHLAWYDACRARGAVITAGPLGNPPDGAMALCRTREGAEEFARGDPFVLQGLVRSWRVTEWKATLP